MYRRWYALLQVEDIPNLGGLHRKGSELEYTRRDPKDGELCPGRMKPGETLVEVRSDTDVQIVRQTWV